MVVMNQARQVSSSVLSSLPLFLRAPVVQGMRRGGKELGIPTGMLDLRYMCTFHFVFNVTFIEQSGNKVSFSYLEKLHSSQSLESFCSRS